MVENMEKANIIIHINKFGPLEKQRIRFKPLMFFTGNSNLGKSYANYLVYFLVSSFTEECFLDFLKAKIKEGTDSIIKIDAIQKWLNNRVSNFMKDFLHADDSFSCDVNFEIIVPGLDSLSVYYLDEVNDPMEYMEAKVPSSKITLRIDGNENVYNIPSWMNGQNMFVLSKVSLSLISSIFGRNLYKTFLLPPGRGAFMGENFSFKDKVSSSIGMYRLFLKDMDFATQNKILRRRSSYSQQISNLVGGTLFVNKDVQYIKLNTGFKIPLSAAASSIKELAPWLYSLQNLPIGMDRSYCIEEPEAHLHPQMQMAVADLLAVCYNDHMMFNVTTHSDYFVQRINQLIKLDYLRRNNNKKFKEICKQFGLSERHCLNKDHVAVYHFELNENGIDSINDVEVSEQGFPMDTFNNSIRQIVGVEDVLNIAIDATMEAV